jgi:rubrerythrin
MEKLINGIQKIDRRIIEIEEFVSFAAIGDPGCDGLGAEIMANFSDLLLEAAGTNFTLVLGDVVPFGSKIFYNNIANFINVSAKNPVFVVCGNHDTNFYDDFFGSMNYGIADKRTLLVVLDNSKRIISAESVDLLQHALKNYARTNIVLAVHIPPPNRVSANSISAEEWAKVTDDFKQYNCTINYIITGHVHSYFEDTLLDGAKLVSTGGGGARIEDVPEVMAPYYHWVRFYYRDDGSLLYERKELGRESGGRGWEEKVRAMLSDSFERECIAHVRYRLYAEDAQRRLLPNLAKLFRAASDAEYYHARNFQYVLEGIQLPSDALAESVKNERYEVEEFYKSRLAYVQDNKLGLPVYAFTDALEAEQVHSRLFESALNYLNEGRDIEASNYYTCTSCGNTFAGKEHPKNCPVCGAPMDKIVEIS